MIFLLLKSKTLGCIRCGLYKSMQEYWQCNGSKDSADYYWEILETFLVPEDYAQKLRHILTFTKDPLTSSDLAGAFYFGLQCGARNEKAMLRSRLSELIIVAGRARWQDTTELHKEIEILKNRLAQLGG